MTDLVDGPDLAYQDEATDGDRVVFVVHAEGHGGAWLESDVTMEVRR